MKIDIREVLEKLPGSMTSRARGWKIVTGDVDGSLYMLFKNRIFGLDQCAAEDYARACGFEIEFLNPFRLRVIAT